MRAEFRNSVLDDSAPASSPRIACNGDHTACNMPHATYNVRDDTPPPSCGHETRTTVIMDSALACRIAICMLETWCTARKCQSIMTAKDTSTLPTGDCDCTVRSTGMR